MNQLPQMAPVSALKNKHLGVFRMAQKAPVVLINRSRPVGVLISLEQWDALAARLDDLEAAVGALEAELALERGEESLTDVDLDALKAEADRESVATEVD